MSRVIRISTCDECRNRDHKGAFGQVSCVPVCRAANKELPHEVVVNQFRHLVAKPSYEIPDWCPLENDSAPDLLDALRDMVRQFENCPEEQSNGYDGAPEPITQWDYDAFQILGQARAAIAKATGVES